MVKVLLLEDRADLRTTLAAMIAMLGHQVWAPTTPSDIRNALEEGQFDLVLTDILMPDIEGIEIILMVRRSRPGCPIVAMSGGSRTIQPSIVDSLARGCGADAFLAKPFTGRELQVTLSEVLERRRVDAVEDRVSAA